jgi:hypothetical protein
MLYLSVLVRRVVTCEGGEGTILEFEFAPRDTFRCSVEHFSRN